MYSFKQEIILKLKGAERLGAEGYPIKQEIILKLKEAARLGVEVYSFKQDIILKLKGAERLGAEVYPFKQEKFLKLKGAYHMMRRPLFCVASKRDCPLTHGRITSTSFLSHASLILSGSGASVIRISTWERSNR